MNHHRIRNLRHNRFLGRYSYLVFFLTSCLLITFLGTQYVGNSEIVEAQTAENNPLEQVRTLGTSYDCTRALAIADFNLDGLLDVVAGNTTSLCDQEFAPDLQDHISFNSMVDHEAGYFLEGGLVPVGGLSHALSIDVGDMNRDGAPDIIVGNGQLGCCGDPLPAQGKQNYILLNDGQGNFPTTEDCQDEQVICFGDSRAVTAGLVVADFDDDGWLDIAAGDSFIQYIPPAAWGEINIFYNRDGAFDTDIERVKTYTQDGTGEMPVVLALDASDFNQDNQLDIVTGLGSFGITISLSGIDFAYDGQENELYLRQGNSFTEQTFGTDNISRGVAIGDVNKDGWLDIVIGNGFTFSNDGWRRYEYNYLYLNDQSGGMSAPIPLGSEAASTLAIEIADIDSDGDLDIITGNFNGSNEIYKNAGDGTFATEDKSSFGSGIDLTESLAVADIDRNGTADIIVGNVGQNIAYLNNQIGNYTTIYSETLDSGALNALDAVLANFDDDPSTIEVVFANHGTDTIHTKQPDGSFTSRSLSNSSARSETVNAADFNNDGLIDLVVGGWNAPNLLYFNDNNQGFLPPLTIDAALDQTSEIQIGDLNDDQMLDIVVNNVEGPNYIYLHQEDSGFGNPFTKIELSANTENTVNIALSDIDLDGDLDIVSTNQDFAESTLIYFNDGSANFPQNTFSCDDSIENVNCIGTDRDISVALAVADLNGDSYPEIVLGNLGQPNKIYINANGRISENATNFGFGAELTHKLIVQDMNGDGFNDIIVANGLYLERSNFGTYGQDNQLFYNDGNGAFPADKSITFDLGERATFALEVADLDANGSLDIVVGSYAQTPVVLYDAKRYPKGSINHHPYVALAPPPLANTATSSGASPQIIDSPTITIPFRLYDIEDDSVGYVQAFVSFDGGGSWQEIEQNDSQWVDLPASADGVQYDYVWSIWDSDFWGQSDNVMVRIDAYDYRPTDLKTENTISRRLNTDIYGYQSAVTNPFRVRGTQVLVQDEEGTPVSDAIVYQFKSDEPLASVVATAENTPLTTDALGYLRGRGSLGEADQLVALRPISTTYAHTIYETSATPINEGLIATPVDQLGTQVLTISSDTTLTLINLAVSLEWDARQDSAYLQQLEEDIYLASQHLFDVTDGQMALGDVHIYHAKGYWNHADVIIRASNKSWPAAVLGGSVSEPLTITLTTTQGTSTNNFIPGQISMPREWNRFGDNEGTSGEDWPRTLVHELGHYLFFLPDSYLGLTEDETQVISVDCLSIMSDPYLHSEFGFADIWQAECSSTLIESFWEKSEWGMISYLYPYMNEPSSENHLIGPSTLPLAVTELEFFSPDEPTNTLSNPYFYLVDPDGTPVFVEHGRADAYLLKIESSEVYSDNHVIPLGSPVGRILEAPGVSSGDRVCVVDTSLAIARSGCTTVSDYAGTIVLAPKPADWQPHVTVEPITDISGPTPISTTTVKVAVSGIPANNDLYIGIQVLPTVGESSRIVPLTTSSLETIISSPTGILQGHIRLIRASDSQFKTIIDEFYIEFYNNEAWERLGWGGKGIAWSGKGIAWGGSGTAWSGKGIAWGGSGITWGGKGIAWGAPTLSGDGQMSIFPIERLFTLDQAYELESITFTPELPSYFTPVGSAQNVREIGNNLGNTSILIRYLADSVPAGYELTSTLKVAYRPIGENTSWHLLNTTVDIARNQAAAVVQGEGTYVLVATLIANQHLIGFDELVYPLQATVPVTEGFSLSPDDYSLIAQYDPIPETWRYYTPHPEEPDLEELVNDLHTISFGAYWINFTQVSTAYIDLTPRMQDVVTGAPVPSLFYGWVGTPDSAPAVESGAIIYAWVGQKLCGTSTVQELNGQLAYTIQVKADSILGSDGCGHQDQSITFTINGRQLNVQGNWDNTKLNFLTLTDYSSTVYLPTISR